MEEERLNVYQHVARFKNKYPLTIGWRYRKNASIVEKHLNPGDPRSCSRPGPPARSAGAP